MSNTKFPAVLADSSYDMFFDDIRYGIGNRMESITDGTLSSVARMLFNNRKNGGSIRIYVDKTNYKINSSNFAYLLEYMGNYENQKNLMVWYYPTNYTDLENNWKEALKGSDRYKINEVMSRWVNGIVIDCETHTTIFIPSLSVRKDKAMECFHRIVAGLPQYEIFKPLFEGANAVTEDEMAMLKSLTEDGEAFKAYEFNFIKTMDFERIKVEKIVGNFAENRMERMVENKKREVDRLENQLDEYRQRITNILTQIDDAQALHMAAIEKAKTAPDINKVIQEFFLNNKNVHIERKSNDKIYFYVKAALSIYDTDVLERYIDNRHSLLYDFRGFNEDVTFDVAKAFYTKVFIDREYRIDGLAKWWINTNARCDKANEQSFTSAEKTNALPNPHIYHYTCIGRHRDLLTQAEQDIDFEQAMLVAVQSTASINWNDGVVIERFVNDIWSNNNSIYWDENNKKFVTRRQILKDIAKEIMANEKA